MVKLSALGWTLSADPHEIYIYNPKPTSNPPSFVAEPPGGWYTRSMEHDLLDEHDLELVERIAARQLRVNRAAESRAVARLEAARSEARRLGSLLAQLPACRRVVLFGSTARDGDYREGSDIDLAIEGADILAAMAIVEASEFKVDIVDLGSIHPIMRSRIEQEGVVLYEAEPS